MSKIYWWSLIFFFLSLVQTLIFLNYTFDSLKLSRVLIPVLILPNCTHDSLNLHIQLPPKLVANYHPGT